MAVGAAAAVSCAVSDAGVLFILWFGAKNVLGTGWRAWDIAAFTTFLSCFTKLTVKSSKAAKLFNSVQKAEVSWKRIKPLMKASREELVPRTGLTPVRPEDGDAATDFSFAYGRWKPIFSGLVHHGAPRRHHRRHRPRRLRQVHVRAACSSAKRPTAARSDFGRQGAFRTSRPGEIAATVGYLGHDPELLRRHGATTTSSAAATATRCRISPPLTLEEEVRAMENGLRYRDRQRRHAPFRRAGAAAGACEDAGAPAPRPRFWTIRSPRLTETRRTRCSPTCRHTRGIRSCFLISHRLYHFPQMQKVIFMEDGKTAVGTHEELMASVSGVPPRFTKARREATAA